MSDSLSVLPTITELVTIGVFLYTTYWAFTIRRVIPIPLFRRQALWVGVVGAYFAGIVSFTQLYGVYNTTNALINFIGSFLFFIGFIVIVAWVDVTIRIARKTDPLRRDTFHWMRLRTFVWAILLLVQVFVFSLALPLVAQNQSPSGLVLLPSLLAIIAVAVTTGPALLLSGSRSKDKTLRTHLKWFGLFVVSLFSTVIAGFSFYLTQVEIPPALGFVVGFTPFVLAAYCLYRSARSLVPIGHLPLAELAGPA